MVDVSVKVGNEVVATTLKVSDVTNAEAYAIAKALGEYLVRVLSENYDGAEAVLTNIDALMADSRGF